MPFRESALFAYSVRVAERLTLDGLYMLDGVYESRKFTVHIVQTP